MNKINFLILIIIIITPASIFAYRGPTVKIPLGAIKGWTDRFENFTLYGFSNVPYAKPPTGNLKFKPPIPIKPWGGVFDADIFAHEDRRDCCQSKEQACEGSQDCLNLNIYTRRVKKFSVNNLRPVLVYIHGGNLIYFTGKTSRYPINIINHDIVFVTVNYRLGLFGFFSTGDKHAPGNQGLKDQVEALRWIKNYIHYFGGDGSKVTLIGNGFGAASVGLHLVSPMSRGLFHGAIMISGSPINFWSTVKDPLELAKKHAQLNKCPFNSSESIVDCFTRRNSVIAYSKLGFYYVSNKIEMDFWRSHYQHWYEMYPVHGPVIEPEHNESERFLIKEPIESILEGDIADVPIFIGTTRDEMVNVACDLITKYSDYLTEDLSKNWINIAPTLLQYPKNDTTSEAIRKFYFGSSTRNISLYTMNKESRRLRKLSRQLIFMGAGGLDIGDPSQEFSDLLSDRYFNFDVLRFTKLAAEKNTKPVYLYQYNYPGKEGINHLSHAEDLMYVFKERKWECLQGRAYPSDDQPFIDKYTKLWINFVEKGNPTPEVLEEFDNVTWTPFTKENPTYLDISTTFTMKDGIYNEERFLFWDSISPLPDKKRDG